MKYTLPLKSFAAVLVFALLTVMTIAPVLAQESNTIERSFDVRPGGTLYLDIDWGDVVVETSSDSGVHVVMERKFRDLDRDQEKDALKKHEVNISADGNDVIVESDFDEEHFNKQWRKWKNKNRFTVDVTVHIPVRYNVEFRTGAGDVEIDGVDGYVEGRTGAGRILLGAINGDVHIDSGAGDIDISGANGDIDVDSGAGNITIDDASGEIDVSTGAGNIVVRITGLLTGDSELESGAGNVTVYLDDSVGADVDADSGIGSARTDYDLKVRGKWMSKSFSGEVNGGGHELVLESGVGNVSLRKL